MGKVFLYLHGSYNVFLEQNPNFNVFKEKAVTLNYVGAPDQIHLGKHDIVVVLFAGTTDSSVQEYLNKTAYEPRVLVITTLFSFEKGVKTPEKKLPTHIFKSKTKIGPYFREGDIVKDILNFLAEFE